MHFSNIFINKLHTPYIYIRARPLQTSNSLEIRYLFCNLYYSFKKDLSS